MYKSLLLVAIISVVLLLSVNAQASQITSKYTIPSTLSAGTPFIWVVETQALQSGNRLSWQKYLSPTAAGSFNMLSPSKWACFFADDSTATCGPNPLIQPTGQKTGTFQGNIQLAGPGFNQSSDFILNVSDLQVVQAVKNINGPLIEGSVYVRNVAANVTYTLYTANNLTQLKSGQAEYRTGPGDYYINITLTSGKYFIAFEAQTTSAPIKNGGYVMYFEIGGGSGAPIQTGLDIAVSSIDTTTVAGDTVDRQFTIKNPTTTSYSNLSISMSDSLKQYVTVDLVSKSLQAGNSSEYVIKVRADKSLIIKDSFDIVETANGVPAIILKTVPLDIKISVTGGVAGPTTLDKPVLDVDPPVIPYIKILTGNESVNRLIVRNLGAGNLTLQQPEIEGFTGDIITVTQPNPVITSTAPGEVTITIKPTNPGDYTGKVKIKSDGGVKIVYLSFSAFDDVTSDIDKLRSEVGSFKGNLTKQGVTSSEADKFFAPILLDLDNSKTKQQAGDYQTATILLQQAESKFSLAKSILSSGAPKTATTQGEFPILLVVIVIIIAVLAFIIVKKKILKKKPSAEDEEQYEEEGYGEEEEYDK
ncbi:MAG: hypothetical protein HY512_00510 [Candidatus Aenigmarchaeota archaeon]|nr:hypothetical protein [Candidatus Aenigmarchaeota archaeon]